MGKILLIDVDGTLVDYDNQLPASAVDAIRKARANEHKVYICTGRSKAEVYPNLWEIGLDGMIGGNGSYVEDHGKVVMHQLITKEQCIHVVDWLHARGLEFYLESNSGLFASEKFEEVGEPAVRLYSSRKGKDGAQQLRVRDAFPDMIFGGELYRDDVNKISYVLTSYKDFEDAKKSFRICRTEPGAVQESLQYLETSVSKGSPKRMRWSACWITSEPEKRTRSHLETQKWISLCSSAAL